MTAYYNKTRGPIPVALRRGGSMLIGSKKWGIVAPEDDGDESLLRAVSKGDLVRGRVPLEIPPEVSVPEAAAKVEPPAPLVVPEPVQALPVAPVVRSGKKGR